MNQYPRFLATVSVNFHQLVHQTPPELRILCDLLKFLIEKLIAHFPIHVSINDRKKESDKIFEVFFNDFFPRAVKIVHFCFSF
ncbi:MAG: hypothetical protein C4527_19305 [Candidatus Omnitrophota bacterium]|nr:MAG: hypothetical protein C4527_19305 [Candidatus Omnitrophota bacterium]